MAYKVVNTSSCLGCTNSCANACKQDALELKHPNGIAHINPDNCTNCGACAEACKYGAIKMLIETKVITH